MKWLLLFIGFSFAAGMLQSCEDCCSKKTLVCPAYDDVHLNGWIPYKAKGQLVFATASGEMDTLRIDSLILSEKSNLQNSCSKNNCESSFLVVPKAGANVEKALSFKHVVYGGSTSTANFSNGSVTISFLKGNVFGNGFSIQGIDLPQFDNCPAKVSYLPQATLNTKVFTMVQEIALDTSCKSPTVFRKLYLAKNRGIIGYQTNADGKLWVLQ
ncbi:MAG: hypothetical protein V4722_05065 [Bacteroidota bacterium]